MAHFAELDESRVEGVAPDRRWPVLRTILFDAPDGPEGEAAVTAWAGGGLWKQTSYNAKIRKKFAGFGDVYDEARDAFYPWPPPFWSWSLDEQCKWQPPVPYPSDASANNPYEWDEVARKWRARGRILL